MDVNGEIRDRRMMGVDLFWALRGGEAASFGVVLSWKVKLARVPEKVTCFISQHTVGPSMNKLVHRWQSIGSKLDEDLFIRVIIDNSQEENQRTMKSTFQTLFLGGIDRLIPLMNQKFPELGLRSQDCSEMSWKESIIFFNWKSGQPLEIILNRDLRFEDQYFKAKSNFVQTPVPENVFEEITKRFLEKETPLMILEPLGGKIDQISETESPYPHRRGNLYNIQYMVKWKVNEVEEMNKHVRWMRSLHDYMTPYVSKSPRGAYLNYRDLDLGTTKGINTSFEDARKWGETYFKDPLRVQVVGSAKAQAKTIIPLEQIVYRGIVDCFSRTYRESGFRGLYRGVAPSLYGIFPYAGLKFYFYEEMKRHVPAEHKKDISLKLVCGSVAGLLGQTLTYPLDVVRRQMQVERLYADVKEETRRRGTTQTIFKIAREEGWKQLFSGISINYLKVVPSVAIGFTVYDVMKLHLRVPQREEMEAEAVTTRKRNVFS